MGRQENMFFTIRLDDIEEILAVQVLMRPPVRYLFSFVHSLMGTHGFDVRHHLIHAM